jgi:putative transposase
MDLWAYQNGVKIDFSRPGKPTDNAFIESFNGTFRAECRQPGSFKFDNTSPQVLINWLFPYCRLYNRSSGEASENARASRLRLIQPDPETLACRLNNRLSHVRRELRV